MSYAVAIDPAAERQIAAQPEPLQTFIKDSLQRLAQSPSAFSRPVPAGGRGQLAEFRFEAGGAVVWVTVAFLYYQDEQTLHIESILTEFGG